MDRRRCGGSVLSISGIKGEVTAVEPNEEERAIGRRAAESRATVPVLELSVEAPTPATDGQLVQACASALRRHPRANSAYRDGRFELYSRVNVGVVVAEGERYLVPTLFDADTKSVAELDDEIARLSHDAIGGQLSAAAFRGATFTAWNAARHGLSGAAIPIVPPQAGALSAGSERLTLACDHRILYGAAAAAFLGAVKAALEAS